MLSNKVLCNHLSTYSYTLPSVPLLVERTWEHVTFEPQYEIDEGLGTRYDVEWSRQSSAVLKVTHPQLGSRKLPLLICLALKQKKKRAHNQMVFKIFQHVSNQNSSASPPSYFLMRCTLWKVSLFKPFHRAFSLTIYIIHCTSI